MSPQTKPALTLGEFIPLMALMFSLVALSIDAMLPALADIGADLQVKDTNDQQLVILALLFGLGIAPIIYGPLSDSYGRRPIIFIGFAIYGIGCVLSLICESFEVMLLGRVLQGIGAAGPRTVGIALIRDQYEGRKMARVMSFVMGVFIIVPALAPALGQGILFFAHWRAIFASFLVLSLISCFWFALRQPETHGPEHRQPISIRTIGANIIEVVCNRVAFGYTIISGMLFGAFATYLATAPQLFGVLYGITDLFPLCFAALALALGFASFVNGRLVERLGMRKLMVFAFWGHNILVIGYFAYAFAIGGIPNFWLNMGVFMLLFLFTGFLFGNMNALAMEPLGHIAGVGAAVVGTISTLLSVPLGLFIGRLFDGTILPLVGGFAVLGFLSAMLMWWIEANPKRS